MMNQQGLMIELQFACISNGGGNEQVGLILPNFASQVSILKQYLLNPLHILIILEIINFVPIAENDFRGDLAYFLQIFFHDQIILNSSNNK